MPTIEHIFDNAAFSKELHSCQQPIPLFRNALNDTSEKIAELFEQGCPIHELVNIRSDLIDELLYHAWKLHIENENDLALIAVGGYGRGELHPYSDVDIMILLRKEPDKALCEVIEPFLTFLWDIGLEIGHSVRTVDDCINESRQDITVATNLMEARLLTGPISLFQEMWEATSPGNIWNSQDFFKEKWNEQRQRHSRFDDSAYNLEPNIKEGPGGLRDIQMIGWVAKRHFGAESMYGLVRHGFLTKPEFHTLREGQDLIWRIRFALHLLTKRREDRLLFDYQKTIATQFGYEDNEKDLAVEQLMQSYYRTVLELNRLNEMLLQLFQEVILLGNQLEEPVPINSRFQSRNGYIEVTSEKVFRHHPTALLEIFLLLQTHDELKGVRATTIRLIRSHRHLIDDEFRHSSAAISLFMEIMRQPRRIAYEVRRMNRYGILAAYIPAFANIVGRMQYDLFHLYTVDEHTLKLLSNIRRLTIPEHAHEFPISSRLMQTIPKQELLYIAVLFHDIAKGRGGDHSKLGAVDAMEFCRLHQLSKYDSSLVSWLVENHLIMSMTSQRKDVSDPEEIHKFASKMVDANHLDYLLILTVADIRATNPKRWNSWLRSLMVELYTSTRRALLEGLDNVPAEEELIYKKKGEAIRILHDHDISPHEAQKMWVCINADYFLHHSPDEIAWHYRTIIPHQSGQQPIVAVRRETEHGGTEILIYGPEQKNLFAISTCLLDQLGLTIVDARFM
ncbi:MAG: [protein-PII] uridylyltransferase, partial [Candidatus Polarisedimenticolaceae bacterium]|nr:[protein-PII] uridylyltransferase [Candidatus Polarisedimenticolaceae bacterium]